MRLPRGQKAVRTSGGGEKTRREERIAEEEERRGEERRGEERRGEERKREEERVREAGRAQTLSRTRGAASVHPRTPT
eukprot:2715369-Rhodomonas_salina.2